MAWSWPRTWHDYEGQTGGRIVRDELTEPYAALLADGMVEGVLAEAEAIRKGTKAEDGPAGKPPSADSAAVSYYELMAEGEGFEPSSEV
jgi:hypothetical protein